MDANIQQHNNQRLHTRLFLLSLSLFLFGHSVTAANLVTTYEYDAEGNQTVMFDAKGQRFDFVYDELNRLTETQYSTVFGSEFYTPVRTEYDYDPNNNVTAIREIKNNETGGLLTDVTVQRYDLLDRLTSKTERGYDISYSYDDNGNRTTVTSAGITTTYTFDNRNRLRTATQPGAGITTYTYRADNRQIKVEYPNGTETVTTYDGANRTKTVINQMTGTLGLISSYVYDYDQNGNRISQQVSQPEIPDSPNITTTYSYDNNDRMTGYEERNDATQEGVKFDYQYDAVYNRISETAIDYILPPIIPPATEAGPAEPIERYTRTYTYDETHWLIQISEGDRGIDYTYDENGNTLTRIDTTSGSPAQTNFYYDSRDQLVKLTRGPPISETTQGRYDYDYRGMRVRHFDSERGNIHYSYDGNAILDERDADTSALIAHYNYADRLLSLTQGTDTQFYHFSALRTTANLTDESGAIQVSYHTDPWGSITQQQGISINRQVFTGQEHDENTGLIYFGARYYDPATARFINQDPYLGEFGTPPSLHRYLYAYGNPTVYVDLFGYESIFGDATDTLMSFIDWSKGQEAQFEDKTVTGYAGAGTGGVSRMVAGLGTIITEPLDYIANLAQVGVGKLTGTESTFQAAAADLAAQNAAIVGIRDFFANGGASVLADKMVDTTIKGFTGDVSAFGSFVEVSSGFAAAGPTALNAAKSTVNVSRNVITATPRALHTVVDTTQKMVTKVRGSLTGEGALLNGNRVRQVVDSAAHSFAESSRKITQMSRSMFNKQRLTPEMLADPYHPAWKLYRGPKAVGADVVGMRQIGAFKGMTLTGRTSNLTNRVSKIWRSKYGPSVNRRHHLGPQALLNDKIFRDQMRNLGFRTRGQMKTYLDRQIADISNVKHMQIHAEGWNKIWAEWLRQNKNFNIKDIQSQIKSMVKEFNIPKGSLGGPKY